MLFTPLLDFFYLFIYHFGFFLFQTKLKILSHFGSWVNVSCFKRTIFGWCWNRRNVNAILLSPTGIASSLYHHNPVIHNSICIWKQLRRMLLFLLSISANPSFCPSMLDNAFEIWKKKKYRVMKKRGFICEWKIDFLSTAVWEI